ncbi:UNVERIFIED_CONTAM: hypothetical protein FKN15_037540 [Acipenser sinensis]
MQQSTVWIYWITSSLVLYKECTGNTISRRDIILQPALELRQKHFDKRHESQLANAPQPSASAVPTGTQNKTMPEAMWHFSRLVRVAAPVGGAVESTDPVLIDDANSSQYQQQKSPERVVS